MKHILYWRYRKSLNWQIECSCGWTSHVHIMERDAIKEASQHRRDHDSYSN